MLLSSIPTVGHSYNKLALELFDKINEYTENIFYLHPNMYVDKSDSIFNICYVIENVGEFIVWINQFKEPKIRYSEEYIAIYIIGTPYTKYVYDLFEIVYKFLSDETSTRISN
jgi:hypothetical protein